VATISEALTIALGHHQRGRLAEAEQIYRQILQVRPDQPDALHLLGVVHSQRGQYDAAIDSIRRAIQIRPGEAAFHGNLGVAYRGLGRLDEAVASCRRALEIQPDFADAHYNLGLALLRQGNLSEAIACYQRALRVQPGHANAMNSLGNAMQAEGRFPEAADCYQRAIQVQPNFPQAHTNLGAVYRAQGKLDEAVACHRRALQIRPDYAEAHHNLANALKTAGRLDEAAEGYRRAIHFQPDYAKAHHSLGNVFRDQHRVEEAAACYRRALELRPNEPLWELRLSILCPTVFQTSEEIDRFRGGLLADWTRLAGEKLELDVAELAAFGSEPPLGLQYQGRDDRPLKEAYAKIFRHAFPDEAPRPGSGRPRIGFVVTARHESAFLASMRGVLQHVTPEKFELVVICQPTGDATMRSAFADDAIGTLVVPERLDLIARTIRAARFDVLYHWEVGTDATNYFLPFLRLAPVQCTSWGIPETSGVSQIDYYLSSSLVEPEDAEEHYTERLLLADTLLAYHERVALPGGAKGREAFGFAPGQNVYLCPQKLGKIHPDFDAILAGILRRDDRGLVVLVADRYSRAAAKLRERFSATIPDAAGRIVFLPRQSYPDYLGLVAASDVLLDTLHFGGGFTTYQGFSLGKAIVTLPGQFQRGRYTLGCYRKMAVSGAVAADREAYVELAVSLGQDEDRRASLAEAVRTASPRLFRDMDAVREHERLFERMADEARGMTG
jgi:predicted O-linked N-acetylglucosamine transferase (SPINDLY family)